MAQGMDLTEEAEKGEIERMCTRASVLASSQSKSLNNERECGWKEVKASVCHP